MRTINLREFKPTEQPVELTPEERDALQTFLPSVTVEPWPFEPGKYRLTPGSIVGVADLGSVSVVIHPKFTIEQVLFLVSYALDPVRWAEFDFDFASKGGLVEALVPGYLRQLERSLSRGLLQGYLTIEDALPVVRGRVRFSDQVGRWYGRVPPVEVQFDEFTEDIEINRVLRAAVRVLLALPLRSPASRLALLRYDRLFERVSIIDYDARSVPDFVFTRLNDHYKPAVRLAQLILRSAAVDLAAGGDAATRFSAFTVDMNDVFENFVVIALREALGLTEFEFPQGSGALRLDDAGRVRLEPDMSWWEDGQCVFVGDAKYQAVKASGIKHPNLYQLLAYVTAAGLRSGLLVYAKGVSEPVTHTVVDERRTLQVIALDLAGDPPAILGRIAQIARVVRAQRAEESLRHMGDHEIVMVH